MCSEDCNNCLEGKSCCSGVFHPLIESCRDDCVHAIECGCEGMCQFYEIEE